MITTDRCRLTDRQMSSHTDRCLFTSSHTRTNVVLRTDRCRLTNRLIDISESIVISYVIEFSRVRHFIGGRHTGTALTPRPRPNSFRNIYSQKGPLNVEVLIRDYLCGIYDFEYPFDIKECA